MCCILEELLSDLGTFLRQFLAYFVARLVATYQLVSRALCWSQAIGSSGGKGARCQQQADELEEFTTGTRTGPSSKQFEYKMMSKKGLLKFVKYTLIFSNAFGFILSIFLGLFGIAYPDKHFPLSYKGREMALCSLFCMLFTTIGYCGAQNHRRILLIIYGATNVIIVIIVVILWFLFRENSILGNKEISNMFITTLAITIAVMFLFAFILAFHIRTFKDDAQDSIVSQSHQLLQQTTAFLQQQQQHQLQAQAAAAAAAGHLAPPNSAAGPPSSHLQMDGVGGATASSSFGMPMANQTQQLQLQQQQHHQIQHQPHLPPPHLAMHQQQQDLMMLGHHHPQSRSLMGQPQQAMQMTHIKGPGTGQRNKSMKAPGSAGKQHLMGPQSAGLGGAHQMALMRNQSSPLPGQVPSSSNYQTTGRTSGGIKNPQQQQQQQVYSQSSKHPRSSQPPEPPSPPSPPPPPPPPAPPTATISAGGGGGGANHLQQQQSAPPNNQQQAQQHHQQAYHQSLRQPGTARMPPACPVQYCTFDCDRTV